MTIVQISENITQWLDVDASALLGCQLDSLVRNGSASVAELGELEEE